MALPQPPIIGAVRYTMLTGLALYGQRSRRIVYFFVSDESSADITQPLWGERIAEPLETIQAPAMLADLPDVMTVPQVAEVLGVCTKTVYKLISDGELRHLQVGQRNFRVTKLELLRYLGALPFSSDNVEE